MAKKHWMQTKEGREWARQNLANRRARGDKSINRLARKSYQKNRKNVTNQVRPLVKTNSQSTKRTLTVYSNNPNTGGIEVSTFKISSFGEMVSILYEKFAGEYIHEVRYV